MQRVTRRRRETSHPVANRMQFKEGTAPEAPPVTPSRPDRRPEGRTPVDPGTEGLPPEAGDPPTSSRDRAPGARGIHRRPGTLLPQPETGSGCKKRTKVDTDRRGTSVTKGRTDTEDGDKVRHPPWVEWGSQVKSDLPLHRGVWESELHPGPCGRHPPLTRLIWDPPRGVCSSVSQ